MQWVYNFPLSIPVSLVDGKAKVKTTVNSVLTGLGILGGLPDCTVAAFSVSSFGAPTDPIKVLDSTGNVFAVPGLYLPEIAGGS